MVVRQSSVTKGREETGFTDAADFESLRRQGDAAVRGWIDKQLQGTSVTVVLVGAGTCSSRWVKYEIDQSIARGNGLLGVDISEIRAFDGTTTCCGRIPHGYAFYRWITDRGYENLGNWVDKAALDAGR